MRRPVPLAPVLEPVADLGEREPGLGRQSALLVGGRIPVVLVAFLQGNPRLFLEAVHRVLAVPDGLGKGVLSSACRRTTTRSSHFNLLLR